MPTYKLMYFNVRGRAEPARMMFEYAGIPYEDVRFEREQWAAIKPTTPCGQVPLLEIDGEMISQSNAIYRYVAKKAGLMGSSDLDEARIDMAIGCVDDFMKDIPAIFRESDEEKKKVLRSKFQDALPTELAKLEKLVKGNYFVGNKLSVADIDAACVLTMPAVAGVELNLDNFPKLKAMQNKVFSEPKIAAWIKRRPKTTM